VGTSRSSPSTAVMCPKLLRNPRSSIAFCRVVSSVISQGEQPPIQTRQDTFGKLTGEQGEKGHR
jgi:hypothetical protein